MEIAKRAAALICGVALLLALCACGAEAGLNIHTESEKFVDARLSQTADLSHLKLSRDAWQYDETHDVCWMSNIAYCTEPQDTVHETLSIFVPGKYLYREKNADGTYDYSIDYAAKVNGYTAATAPLLLAVNTTNYEAKAAPSAYRDGTVSQFLKAGMVYVSPGLRGTGGKNPGNAPWGVADLKAVVRFLRLNMERLPGDPNQIFAFGTGAGGALSAILGASGDSEDYLPYLDSIGAALKDEKGESISDAVCGAMCWNSSPSPDTGDSAYEWLLGQYAQDESRKNGVWTSALSRDLAAVYALQVNGMRLTDSEGNRLTLEPTRNGIYTSGGYANVLKSMLERSLNRYLQDTKFPASVRIDGRTVDCKTAQEYIDALNSGEEWISYDEDVGTVSISKISGFARQCAGTLKAAGVLDGLERETPENQAFSISGVKALHFDAAMSELLAEHQSEYAALSGWKYAYPPAYYSDLGKTDELGHNAETRRDLYSPLYFLSRSGGRYGSSTPAKYWRINCGVTENGAVAVDALNLSLALQKSGDMKKVRLTPVWRQKNALPENTGSGVVNFLHWVETCCPAGK